MNESVIKFLYKCKFRKSTFNHFVDHPVLKYLGTIQLISDTLGGGGLQSVT